MPLTVPDEIYSPPGSYPGGFRAAMALMATSIQAAFSRRQAYYFRWADQSEQDATTTSAIMRLGDHGYRIDLETEYEWNGSAWVSYKPDRSGLVPIVPTLQAPVTGVAIDANGKITFTAVTGSPIFNSAFTSEFDDYLIKFKLTNGSSGAPPALRLAKAGTPSTASVYDNIRVGTAGSSGALNDQNTLADDDHLLAAAVTAGAGRYVGNIEVFDPMIASLPTMLLQQSIGTPNPMTTATSASIGLRGTQHRTLDAYDGFQIIPPVAVTGVVKIYGYADMD